MPDDITLPSQMMRALPIWWDPPPFEDLIRAKDPELLLKYLELDAELVAKELEFQATKVREVAKLYAQYRK